MPLDSIKLKQVQRTKAVFLELTNQPKYQFLKMDRKVFLLGLIHSCPLISASPDCPLEVFRQYSLVDLVSKTSQLSEKEILAITQYHVKCKREREQETLANSA